jgi:pyridoxal phosphate enzyme (YggS family)
VPKLTPFEVLTKTCEAYGATLVAVSKTRTIAEMMTLYAMGQRIFGENRPQEIVAKAPLMPPDVQWHLIGHLQTNKVRNILPLVSCIHSVDSERLWEMINEEAEKMNQQTDVLLQIKIAQEETKFGWNFHELTNLLLSNRHLFWKNVNIRGVMGMATLSEDHELVRKEMRQLKFYFDMLKKDYFRNESFSIISMGMSGDYQIALEEGSNMIRIGTKLFE